MHHACRGRHRTMLLLYTLSVLGELQIFNIRLFIFPHKSLLISPDAYTSLHKADQTDRFLHCSKIEGAVINQFLRIQLELQCHSVGMHALEVSD